MLGFGMPGMTEWIVILVIVLIFFGAGKLPQVFAQAGKGLKAFKDASEGRPTGTEADGDEDEEAAPVRRKQLAARDPDDLDDEPADAGTSRTRKQRTRED